MHAALRASQSEYLTCLSRVPEFESNGLARHAFDATKSFFRKHADHAYSFTDCTSFVVMRELKLTQALTSDRHFTQAGFEALLPTM